MKYGEVERSCLLTPAGFPPPLLLGACKAPAEGGRQWMCRRDFSCHTEEGM